MSRPLVEFDIKNRGRLPEDVAEVVAWTVAKNAKHKTSSTLVGFSNYVWAEYYTFLRKETQSMKRMVAATVRGEFEI